MTIAGDLPSSRQQHSALALRQGELEDAAQRDLHPVGPVVQLVRNLVDALLEQQEGQQDRELALLAWHQAARPDGLEIRAEVRRAHPLAPEARPRLQRRNVFRPKDRARCRADQGLMSSVVERAKHSRGVAQGRALQAPLVQRAGGLALEIDEDAVGSRVKNLAQVKVAVTADPHAIDPWPDDRAACLKQSALARRNTARRLKRTRWKGAHLLSQLLQRS